jgi:Ca2+-transporting ATPase
VLPAFALATGEGENDVLRHPPRDPREPLLGKPQWWFIAVYGAILTASTLASLLIGHYELGLHGDGLVTVSFLTLAFAQLFHVFNMRGRRSGLFVNAVTRNPYVWLASAICASLLLLAVYAPPLAGPLRLEAPNAEGWSLVIATSIAPLLLGTIISAIAHLLKRDTAKVNPS